MMGVACGTVSDEVVVDGAASDQPEDDVADGWFPESVAAGYDTPGGGDTPEAVESAVQVLEDLAAGGTVPSSPSGPGGSPPRWRPAGFR